MTGRTRFCVIIAVIVKETPGRNCGSSAFFWDSDLSRAPDSEELSGLNAAMIALILVSSCIFCLQRWILSCSFGLGIHFFQRFYSGFLLTNAPLPLPVLSLSLRNLIRHSLLSTIPFLLVNPSVHLLALSAKATNRKGTTREETNKVVIMINRLFFVKAKS